jgi:multidrug efflux system outer membrane protein
MLPGVSGSLCARRLAVVSIYKALGGGWEMCAQADQDCSGADGISNLRVVK